MHDGIPTSIVKPRVGMFPDVHSAMGDVLLTFEIEEIQEIIDGIVHGPKFEATPIAVSQVAFQISPRGILKMPNIPTRARNLRNRKRDFGKQSLVIRYAC